MNLTTTLSRSILMAGVLAVPFSSVSQSISGFILDQNNDPVPFANVYVRELGMGAEADGNGKYFLSIDPGIYHLVVSSVGFESQMLEVVIRDRPVVRNFYLKNSSIELNEIVVKVRRRDPAYDIIQEAIRNREKYRSSVNSYRAKVYMRAAEEVDINRKRKQEKETNDDEDEERSPLDLAEQAKRAEEARLMGINLVEMHLTLNYQHPGRYKEERTAYELYGSPAGLFVPVFSETDFNFYENLVDLKGISEVPAISPISRTAILSYRFTLEDILKESGKIVYKIGFSPRKSGDATGKGTIFINDSTWNINRIEFSLHKGGLKFYDDFTIRQTYERVVDSLWIPARQEFVYQTKAGSKLLRGNTVLIYADFEKDYVFPPKFFGNEVAVITREAYERDSSYWNATRPEPLTPDQQRMVAYRDSVEAAHKDKNYLDSIEARYNRVTLGEVLYSDIGFRKDSTKRWIHISSLLSTVGFEIVGGWRLGPRVSWYRQFENGRFLGCSVAPHMGLKNRDLQGRYSMLFRYDPFHLGDFGATFGRAFYTVNPFDAYLNQLKISNYILHDFFEVIHRREFFNGFYLTTNFRWADRKPVTGYDAETFIDEIFDQGEALDFEGYRSVITHVGISYTPFQRYIREPNRKVVLGSKYPTFHFFYSKGWDGLMSSEIDFDYAELSMDQRLLLGTLGNSRYSIKAGKFLNTRLLPFVDLKRFRQSDPYLWSDPMGSFQLLDTALSTTGLFIEGHYLHHFNGAMINNIPLVKKLRIRTVGGAGFMWIKENNYRYEEIFAGIERIVKLGARRRLKIGLYGVLGESNFSGPAVDWKVSFDIIDNWKREWSY